MKERPPAPKEKGDRGDSGKVHEIPTELLTEEEAERGFKKAKKYLEGQPER